MVEQLAMDFIVETESLAELIRKSQVVSIAQGEKLGVGEGYLKEKDMNWVITKFHIEMYAYPSPGDAITIRTKPIGFSKLTADRLFEFYHSNGEAAGIAYTQWAVIDSVKRRLKPIEKNYGSYYGIDRQESRRMQYKKIEKLEEAKHQTERIVVKQDIDSNDHVNNTRYLDYFYQSLQEFESLEWERLSTLEIAFKKEARLGDRIFIKHQDGNETDTEKVHRIHQIEGESGEILVQIESFWN